MSLPQEALTMLFRLAMPEGTGHAHGNAKRGMHLEFIDIEIFITSLAVNIFDRMVKVCMIFK